MSSEIIDYYIYDYQYMVKDSKGYPMTVVIQGRNCYEADQKAKAMYGSNMITESGMQIRQTKVMRSNG